MPAAEIDRMIVRLIGDGSSYEKMLKKSEALTSKTMKNIGRSLQSIGAGMSRLGRQLFMKVTLPLVALGTASTIAFASFDKAMIESTSIMQVTTQQMQEMRDLAADLSFSGEALQGATDLAESYFFLASAGKDAAQSMALLKPVSTFATAGAFGMAQATDLLTDAQSALGMTSKDVAKDMENLVLIGDTLVKANTLANASVEQFSVALTTKAGASLKAYNIDLNEGVALLAAYADQGIKAQLAGNALDRLVRLLTKSAADNAAEFKRLNIRVFDAQGEFRSFADIIGDLENALEGMSTQQKAATLEALGFEARIQQVILPLIGSSNALRRYAKELTNVSGITEEVASKQMKSFANQMKVVSNQIKITAADIGNILSPMILNLSDALTGLLQTWRATTKEFKGGVISVLVAAASLSVLAFVLAAVLGLAAALIFVWPTLMVLLAPVLVPISAVVTLVVTGLAAIAAMLIVVGLEAAKTQEEMRKLSEAQLPGRRRREELLGGSVGLGAPGPRQPPEPDKLARSKRFQLPGFPKPAFITKTTEEIEKGIRNLTLSMREQATTFGMTARQADIYTASLAQITPSILLEAEAADKLLTHVEDVGDFHQSLESETTRLNDSISMLTEGISSEEVAMRKLEQQAIDLDKALNQNRNIKTFQFRDEAADIRFLFEQERALGNLRKAEREDERRALRQGKEATILAKRLQAQQRFAPRASIQAAAVGSAEAQARILAFRSTGPEVSAAETTADEVTLIREILERLEAGETGAEILQSSGLR